MSARLNSRAKYVIGPDGLPLTLADLPASNTRRWVIRRKAIVVAAVRGGLLSLEEACSRYRLTVDEILNWQQSIDSHGLAVLPTTKIQKYRAGLRTPAQSSISETMRGLFLYETVRMAGDISDPTGQPLGV